MTQRGTILLALSALFLWTYLLVWELNQPTQQEKEQQVASVLPQKIEEIASLSFLSSNQRLTLNKQDSGWLVTEPALDEAEDLAIETLLSQLSIARASRSFTEEDPSFGINQQSPSLQITFQDGSKTTILVGADAVGGGLFYAFRSDTKQVLLLPKSLKLLLTQELTFYRAQSVFNVKRDALTLIQLQDGERALILKKKGSYWQQEAPNMGRVDAAKAEGILRSLTSIRAKEFFEKQQHGAGEGKQVTLKTQSGEKKFTLQGPFEEKGARFYVTKRRETFLSIDASEVEPLFAQPEEIRDQKIFTSLQSAQEFLFQKDSASVRLYRDDTGWHSEPKEELDAREIESFREQVEALLVRSFATSTTSPSSQPISGQLQVTFADKSIQTFVLEGVASPEFVWISRDGERVEAPEEVVALLAPEVLRFRSKRMLQVLPSNVTSLQIEYDNKLTTLEKRDSGWWQASPLEAMADQRAVEGLLVAFEDLRALRLLPKTEQPSLQKPLAKIVIKKQDGKTHTLLFGDKKEERERLVQIDSQAPCVVSEALWLALGADWVERRVFFQLSPEAIDSFSLTQKTSKVSLRRSGTDWVSIDGKKFSAILTNKGLQEILDITADEVIPFDTARATLYQMEAPSFTGELSAQEKTTSFVVGGATDQSGRSALRLNQSGPLYLLSAEEASYLKLPAPE
jgi:hypothetical protein